MTPNLATPSHLTVTPDSAAGDDPHVGTAFGHAVVAAVERVCATWPSPPDPDATRGGPRHVPRSVRDLRLRRLQRDVRALPCEVPRHGRVEDRFLRYDATAGTVQIAADPVGGFGPRGGDLATAWATVPDPAARLVIRDALVAEVASTTVAALLLEWAAACHLAAVEAEARGDGDAMGTATARLAEAATMGHRASRALSRTDPIDAGRAPLHVTILPAPREGAATYRAVPDPRGRWLRTAREEWRRLARRAVERNVFYEPELLVPALDELERRRRVDVVCVLERRGDGPERLTGVFPVRWNHSIERMPARVLSLWQHDYAHVTVPLVEAETAHATLHAFWDFVSSPLLPEMVRLRFVPTEGPFWQVLQEVLDTRAMRRWCQSRHERAVFVNRGPDHDHTAANFGSKRRQEFRRLHRRLGDLGPVAFEVLTEDSDLARAVEEFLDLEDSGWKGRRGTSLRSAGHADFFRRVATDLGSQGRLRVSALRLDSRPIAMVTTLVSGDDGWAFKMAFDEAFAAWSPGALLLLDESQRLHGSGLRRIDSTAVADHELVNRMWPDRIGIADLVVARSDPAGAATLATVARVQPAARRLKHAIGTGLSRIGRRDA